MAVLDPTRMRFSQEARRQEEDEKNKGLNCKGCLFEKQKAKVCELAGEAAQRLGLRDCDYIDPFGEAVIYVKYREVRRELIGEMNDELETN